MEGHDGRGRQDDEGGHYVRRRLHRRGQGHDEAPAPKSRPTLWRLLEK